MTQPRARLSSAFGKRAAGLFLCLCAAAALQAAPVDRALQSAREKNLAASQEWKRLLHHKKNVIGLTRSDLAYPSFFLSPRGYKDAQAELDATLAGFYELATSTDTYTHPQCRFPARLEWSHAVLALNDLPDVDCPRFETWSQRMDSDSISLIFSSYYMNNPASMYGHTFLKLNKKGGVNETGLLDYTINFAANVDTANGFLFAMRGLMGGYRGVFSTHPFYMKVQQYNNMESRDIWEYRLNLDDAARRRLVKHLWELGHGAMPYYFLNKNCAYQIFPLLDVADPELSLSDHFVFRAIPLDTLKATVNTPGLVTSVEARPSHLKKMLAARAALSPDEVKIVESLVEQSTAAAQKSLASYAPEKQAQLLDSAYDLWRFQVGFARRQPLAAKETESRLLALRSELKGVVVPPPVVSAGTRPDVAHGTGRVALGFGATRDYGFEEFDIKPALQDLEGDPTGFVSGSQLEMFHVKLRVNNDDSDLFLEKFTVIDIKSLTPHDRWVRKPSWRVHGGLESVRDLERSADNSLAGRIDGGSGMTWQFSQAPLGLLYGLFEVDTQYAGFFDKNARAGAGGTVGMLVSVGRSYRLHASAGFTRYGWGQVGNNNKLSVVQSYSFSPAVELRLALDRQNHYQEGLISAALYF